MSTKRPAIVPWPKQVVMKPGTVSVSAERKQKISSDLGSEEYAIYLREDEILAEAGGNTGLFYASCTLWQLEMQYGKKMPCMEIFDEPVKAYRSFHLDSARHFIPIDELKKIVRMSAFFKLNTFHWHFSDDQGWRIESTAFPRLHQIGGHRRGDYFGKERSDQEEHFFYTRDQIKEFVDYCMMLGIQIVPEVDIPGHATAMLASYPYLGCRPKNLEVAAGGGIFRDILCPGKEETFSFLENLFDDLGELFPGNYFHIGGDEVPKHEWKTCPYCQKRMREEHLENVQQLQGYFHNRLAHSLKERGKTVIVWNEAAAGGNLDTDIVVQLWNDGKAPGSEKETTLGKEFLKKGGRVIMSPVMHAYCDYPYAFVSLKEMYGLSLKPWGMDSISAEEERRVLGEENLLWTEYVRDPKTLERMTWPRFAAGAEIGWCGKAPGNYENFAMRMEKIFPIFKEYEIAAEVPERWVPEGSMWEEQMKEFMERFSQEEIDEALKQQNEI